MGLELEPTVSVCVVTYNHSRFIHDCIMSVVAQSQDVALEILVGDDQSNDGTAEIVAALADRFPGLIRYFRHPEKLGFGTRNYQVLMGKARGKYTAHLDGDDCWTPGKLRRQVEFLDHHPECMAVYTNALTIADDGSALGVFNNPQPHSIDFQYLLSRGNFLNHSSMFYRSFLNQELLAMKAPFLDYQMHLRIALHGMLGYLNEHLTIYRSLSANSVGVHSNDLVRECYWSALKSVAETPNATATYHKGVAEFMRFVFFRAIRVRSWTLFSSWWTRARIDTGIGRWQLLLQVAIAVIRTGCFAVFDRTAARLFGSRFNVLYRR